MAGLIEAGTYKIVSQDGLTEKDITIDNSGNPLFDSTQLAKQSDIGTANSSLVKTALNAGGSAPIYACRAWVNFNGTGTVAIRASGNVSSVTDNGTGDYTVNFTTAMPDANFVPTISQDDMDSATAGFGSDIKKTGGLSASYVRLETYWFGSVTDRTNYDPQYVCVAIFR